MDATYAKNFTKDCQGCGESFQGTHRQKWCSQEKQGSCKKCAEDYVYRCVASFSKFCSIPCGKRVKTPKEKTCGCGRKFTRTGQGCLISTTDCCSFCTKEFNYKCKGIAYRFCSNTCQATHASRHPAAVTAKKDPINVEKTKKAFVATMEKRYGKGVTNPSHLDSVKTMRRDFTKANPDVLTGGVRAKFGVENISQVPEVAARAAETNRVVQREPAVIARRLKKTYPHLTHVDELVELDHFSWATQFEIEKGCLPSPLDLQRYFNAKAPVKIPEDCKVLFDLRDSRLELIFKEMLENCGFSIGRDYFRRKRFLRDADERYGKEIDFFFPAYMIGFEIQDFATHSRVEHEVGMRSMIKNGPTYSRDKIRRASDYGVTLYEVWENEFKDIDALEETVLLSLHGKLIERECPGSLAAHEANQREMRDLIESDLVHPLPIDLRVDEKAMKVWWKK